MPTVIWYSRYFIRILPFTGRNVCWKMKLACVDIESITCTYVCTVIMEKSGIRRYCYCCGCCWDEATYMQCTHIEEVSSLLTHIHTYIVPQQTYLYSPLLCYIWHTTSLDDLFIFLFILLCFSLCMYVCM